MGSLMDTGAGKWSPIARGRIAAIASGLLLSLAFPPLGWWPLAWVALVPLYVALVALAEGRRAPASATAASRIRPLRDGGEIGFFFGLALFLSGAFWIKEIGIIPWILLSVVQAVLIAPVGAAAVALFARTGPGARPWIFAALWVLGEVGRSWGAYAFPWFFLASSQVPAPILLQITAITGQWGLSFACAAFSGLIAQAWILRTFPTRAIRPALLASILAGGFLLTGTLIMRSVDRREGASRTVALVQGNIQKPPGPYDDIERLEALHVYDRLSRRAAEEQPSLILWPETVIPGVLLRDRLLFERVAQLARETATPLLVGSIDVDDEQMRHNAALLVDSQGELAARYDKVQLVPLGEFFPLRNYLGGIYDSYGAPSQDFVPGRLPGVLAAGREGDAARVGVVICYESVFPRFTRERVRDGAQAIAILTSDQTFGTTAGPLQHADMAVLRAVESRRYVLRAASTGVTTVIDPWGVPGMKLGINERGFLMSEIRLRDDLTFYARWGDWFPALCALLLVAVAVSSRRSGVSADDSGAPRARLDPGKLATSTGDEPAVESVAPAGR